MVEHQLPKLRVAGSSPVSRFQGRTSDVRRCEGAPVPDEAHCLFRGVLMTGARRVMRRWFLPLFFVLGWVYAPFAANGPVLCLSRLLLNRECWGCGLTRAMCALVQFDFSSAIAYNPLIFPCVIVLTGVWVQQNSPMFNMIPQSISRNAYQ